MNNDKSIIISLYFNGTLMQEHTIKYFMDIFNSVAFELYYTVTDKTKFNWKLKSRGGKFTKKRFENFREELKNESDNVSIEFELLSNFKKCEYKSRDINVSISYNTTRDFNVLNIVLNSEWQKVLNVKDVTHSIWNLLLDQNCEIVYGLVSEMENSKMPALYFQGIRTENLTQEEENKVQDWSSKINNCDKVIWEIFWGNIISTKHNLNNQIFKDIEEIVGKENIQLLTSTLIWFNLNEPLSSFDITKYSSKRKQLYLKLVR